IVSASLLVLAFLMKSFPVLIFAALAPLLSIVDSAEDARLWSRSELVLVALAAGYLAAHVFDFSFLVTCLAQAIIMTTAFLGYSFVRHQFPAGLITIAAFWLGLEYFLALTPW